MLWLAAHMQFLLFAAFFIGLGVGWWIWGSKAANRNALPPREEALMGTLDSDFQPAAQPEPAIAPHKDKDDAPKTDAPKTKE